MKLFKYIDHFPVKRSGNWNSDNLYKTPRYGVWSVHIYPLYSRMQSLDLNVFQFISSRKRTYLDFNFLIIGSAGVTYLRNHLEYGSCLLYWNYKDGNDTKAEEEKFDVNYSRDLCWDFCALNGGKIFVKILLKI